MTQMAGPIKPGALSDANDATKRIFEKRLVRIRLTQLLSTAMISVDDRQRQRTGRGRGAASRSAMSGASLPAAGATVRTRNVHFSPLGQYGSSF
jgi:hypothetical protein